MPYRKIRKENGKYKVVSPHGVKGDNMSLANANKQIRLLQAIKHNPKFAKKMRRA